MELLGRIDLELVPGHFLDLLIEGRRLFGELLGDRAQQFHVHADASGFHESEHHHQRQFDLLVDEVQFPLRYLRVEVLAQSRDQRHLVSQRLVARRRIEERR